MKKFFTLEEIEFLKRNYPSKGIDFCSHHLKRNKCSLYHFCNRYNIKYTDKYRKKYYKESGKKQSITRSKIKTIHNVDENQFIKIKTPEVAYILGLLWADGSIYTKNATNCISISCLFDDMKNIESIFDKTGKWNKYSHKQDGRKKQLLITTNNKELCKFLLENDYKSKSESSADKILSKIPKKIQHYWFRGLVDGDGCFYFKGNDKEMNIASSYHQNWNYVLKLFKKLKIIAKIKKTIQIQNNHKNKSSTIRLRKFNYIKKFGNYIYQNREVDKIGFDRKYNKFKQICLNFGDGQQQ